MAKVQFPVPVFVKHWPEEISPLPTTCSDAITVCQGKRPTVDDHGEYLLETHLFNFYEDLYDKIVNVEFFAKIRDEKKFNSLEELRAAIAEDQKKAKQILGLSV